MFSETTKAEAKLIYCSGLPVYVSTTYRKYWQLPPSSAYGSHAPIQELFERSIPKYEGKVSFFVKI